MYPIRQFLISVFMMTFAFNAFAKDIMDIQTLDLEIKNVVEERSQSRKGQKLEQLIQQMNTSTDVIARLLKDQESEGKYLQIYNLLIELRQYLEKIVIDKQGLCASAATNKNLFSFEEQKQELEQSSSAPRFKMILKAVCQ